MPQDITLTSRKCVAYYFSKKVIRSCDSDAKQVWQDLQQKGIFNSQNNFRKNTPLPRLVWTNYLKATRSFNRINCFLTYNSFQNWASRTSRSSLLENTLIKILKRSRPFTYTHNYENYVENIKDIGWVNSIIIEN